MLRSLFSAAAIFFLLASSFFLPVNVSARSRCPVKMPETLLALYQNSDAIYVATFDKEVDGEVIEDTADYSSVSIKKHFSISSALKGESRKFVVLDDTDYRYKNTEQAEPAEEEEMEDPEAAITLKPGDTLLLFLKDGGEDDPPTLTDYRDGTKKLSMEHIGVYESRIKELATIFSERKVSEAKIVEWLIRCAEDPVTRWEGTFELLQSVETAEWLVQAAEERQKRIERGETVEPEPAVDNEEDTKSDEEEEEPRKLVDTTKFAGLIDANQKQTLANLLLNQTVPVREEGEEKPKEIAGDAELIELVKRWGDTRLVGYLLDQLRANADEPYAAVRTMNTIAELLKDKEATRIAERYGEIAYEDDAAVTEAEPEETGAPDETTPPQNEEQPQTAVEPASDEPEPAAEEPVKVTYKQMHDNLMQKFIQRCEIVGSGDYNKDSEAVAKAT